MYLPIEIPKTLEECFPILKNNLQQEDLIFIKNSIDEYENPFHFSLGMQLRNEWRLWHDSELAKWFNEKGIFHADDMSGIILISFKRWLSGENILLEEQIKNYQDYWKDK